MEENENFVLDDEAINEEPTREAKTATEKMNSRAKKKAEEPKAGLINCLRNERVIVRHIPKTHGIWGNNPKHVFAGGMAETSVRTFIVPRLKSGMLVNVLTDAEKDFLEDVMGLEPNTMSIYKKTDNFWDDGNEDGINKVRLHKTDNYLDLSNPEDYIKYKILLANKDFIAPSMKALEDANKATYQFVIIAEGEETKMAKQNMSTTMQCYKEYGKVETNVSILRHIVETIDGRPTAKTMKLEVLQAKVNELIQLDSKRFLAVITDPLRDTKVLIKKCIEVGLISNRDGKLYLRKDNSPLCEANEEATLNMAAKYLNSPKHQELLFALQAQTK